MMSTIIENVIVTEGEEFRIKTYKDLERSNKVEYMIKAVLMKIGIKPSGRGFKYLCTSIILMLTDPNKYSGYLTKRLYVDVANEYGTSAPCVERCIRHSIRTVEYTDPEVCYTYLGNENQVCSYTNGDLISAICELMKFNLC